jgi:hypothetical protein
VLAFDDYKYVSSAKSITQANRTKKAAVFQFDERQYLEPKVPKDFNDKLRNRVYKRKVIDCIVASLPKMLDLKVTYFSRYQLRTPACTLNPPRSGWAEIHRGLRGLPSSVFPERLDWEGRHGVSATSSGDTALPRNRV